MTTKLRKDLEAYAARVRARHPDYDRAVRFALSRMARAESDLELGFIMVFVSTYLGWTTLGRVSFGGEKLPWAGDAEVTIDITSQVKLGRDRVDFLFTVAPGRRDIRFAVECDGHAFHDRTKVQASRDRARDRRLLRQGIVTLRFTYDDVLVNSHKSMCDLVDTIKEYSRSIWPKDKAE